MNELLTRDQVAKFFGEKYPKERVFRYLVANCPKI